MSKVYWSIIDTIHRLASDNGESQYKKTTIKPVTIHLDPDAVKRPLRVALLKKVEKFKSRLTQFVDTNLWKVRSEIRITDEDAKLQKLLISLTKTELELQSSAERFLSSKEIKELKASEPYASTLVLLEKARGKIRTELKLRDDRRTKRKIAFLIEP